MLDVNSKIRRQAKQLLIEIGISQKEASERMGMKSPQYLSEMLNTDKSGLPKRWDQLLTLISDEIKEQGIEVDSPLLDLLLEDEEKPS